MATSLNPTSTLFRLGISSNPYLPTFHLLQTNELRADKLTATFFSVLVYGLLHLQTIFTPHQQQKKVKSNEQASVSIPEPSSSLSIPFFATDKVLKWLLSKNQSFSPSPYQHFEIIIDSGASTSYTNNLSDFVSNVKSIPEIPINGIANQLTTTAIETANWFVNDDDGNPATMEHHTMYVPGLPIRLSSLQYLHLTSPPNSDSFSTRSHTSTLRWHLHTQTIHHNQHNNLPILLVRNHTVSIEQQALYCAFTLSNTTLTKPQQQLLNEHYRLCHLPMDIIKRITPTSRNFSNEAKLCEIPLCSSCIIGKQLHTYEIT